MTYEATNTNAYVLMHINYIIKFANVDGCTQSDSCGQCSLH